MSEPIDENQKEERTKETIEENSESSIPPKEKKWDTSMVIAIAAVLISLFSMLISFRESSIMLKQQELISEQQEASVWPYLENWSTNSYDIDLIDDYGPFVGTYEFTVTNKGVGPAIIDSVKYFFRDEEITGWGLPNALSNVYPNIEIISSGNSTLDGAVLAPEEIHSVLKIKLKREKGVNISLQNILNNIGFGLEYCYCSVYGKCWKVKPDMTVSSSDECSFREQIR